MLRESLSGLGRANAIIITRADVVKDMAKLSARLRQYNNKAKIFAARTKIVSLRPLNDGERSIKEPTKSFAFCAVGNPKAFFETLRRGGIEVTGTRAFRDHHRYTRADINDLEKAAAAPGADALLTTGKDAVKLQELKFSLPCFVVEIETTVEDSDEFKRLLLTSS